MKLKLEAPGFWRRPSLLGTLLSPLGMLYGHISGMLQSQTVPFRPNLPVFCVGNITLGGAGKTPVTIALASLLHSLQETPYILSRGYGAAIATPFQVDLARHTATQVGDEPLLLARHAPTWVSPNRASSSRLITREGKATLLLLDDGLQHGGIARDTSFLVIDTGYGVGNGHIVPAGPLRETLTAALQKSHAIIALGEAPLSLPQPHSLPVFRARKQPTAAWQELRGQEVFAFSGLANNHAFFRMCEANGMTVSDRVSFPDHHAYTRAEAKQLLHRAHLLGAIPVTTEKDAVKLHPEERARVHVLPIELIWENRMELLQFVIARLAHFHNAPPTLSF